MTKEVNILTVLPTELAQQLSQQRRLKDYNTLPKLNQNVLEAVREFMIDNVGYEHLPMACLCANAKNLQMDSSEIFHILPANSKNSVLFIIRMPEDMIVSVPYQALLDASEEADACGDDEDSIELFKDDFKSQLSVGQLGSDSDEEVIEFIPYLDYSKCKGYANFNQNFGTDGTANNILPDIKEYAVAKLTAFID